MCRQVLEVYAQCKCLYYQHAVDGCPRYGTRGHGITQRTIYVGYTCLNHTVLPPPVPDSKRHISKASNPEVNSVQQPLYTSPDYASRDKDLTIVGGISTAQSSGHCQRKGKDAERETAQTKIAVNEVSQNDDDPFELEPDSDSDESAISNTWSEVSVASSTTTVDEDALEAIFRRLLLFESLRYLWPQLVTRSGSKTRCLRTLERVLRRWSEDLGILAASSDFKSSDSMIYLSACRFVRKSRLNIAKRLWEAHHQDVEHRFSDDLQNYYDVERLMEDKYDPEDDDNFVYAVSEKFA